MWPPREGQLGLSVEEYNITGYSKIQLGTTATFGGIMGETAWYRLFTHAHRFLQLMGVRIFPHSHCVTDPVYYHLLSLSPGHYIATIEPKPSAIKRLLLYFA